MPELNLAPSFEDTTDVVTRDFTKPAAPAKRDRSHLTQVSDAAHYVHVPSPAQKLQADLRTQLSMPFPDPSPETQKIPTVYTVTALVLFCGSVWTAVVMGLAHLL
ncbi:hypothetical protein [Asticcacaulis endophyticus]|uniref:Uncharacterized protein n=1 Tax=Asticcacaulis endophyticus TaxID=1395890 RepID=A0A918PWR9_9CAUL|nr:hypothetical protein [Asticcacaulis endophyticus]GGZ25947.1 hypothetical protein GCM10011273_09240 [Asticcacaulis endophyticus]